MRLWCNGSITDFKSVGQSSNYSRRAKFVGFKVLLYICGKLKNVYYDNNPKIL